MSIKKRVWCWIIAGLVVAVGAGLYYGIPHFSRWVSELRVTAPNTADLGTEEKPAETPDKPAIKRGWSSKSIGLVVGLTVGGSLFLGAVRRKQRLAKKTKDSLEPGLGVTTPAPTPATSAAGTSTTTTTTTVDDKKKGKTTFEWQQIGKTSWSTFALLLPISLVLVAAVLLRPDWQKDIDGWRSEPRVWAIAALVVALLWMAIRSGYHRVLGWLLALGLVSLIIFLIVDAFGVNIQKTWDNTWRSSPPSSAGTTTSMPVATPEPTSGTIVVIAKPCQWSGWDIKIPDYCDFVTDPSADVEFENLFGERTIDGPDRVVHWGKNLPPQKRHFRVRALGHKDATVTVQWKKVNCK